ncbi:MAG: hypothetical protein IJ653_05930 [Bacteroidales bacterium]|nr:hypothetical protein [Bacteroidales bacterium]
MKKIILVLLTIFLGFFSFAQEHSADELKKSMSYGGFGEIITPRYKLYQTENIYNLLKLDTATGAIWMVQYSMNEHADAMEVAIDDSSLLKSSDEEIRGRYELYPTKNKYTFILLDTVWGYPYQVQWSTNPKERFRVRIYP